MNLAARQRIWRSLSALLFLTLPAASVTAQTLTTLHSFTGSSDGAFPYAGLILSGNTLYGTAAGGGSSNKGTVFRVNTDGSAFTNLHSFVCSSDGCTPHAGLILTNNTLYGTTFLGGEPGYGALFAINTDGSDFTNLYNFSSTDGSDGASPESGLILSGDILYGTAGVGGDSANGTVFAVSTDGTGFTNLHSFTVISGPSPSTNSDGANPYDRLILSGNTVYGTTFLGGSSGRGTVFKVNTDATGFTNLHSFTGGTDGAFPYAGLILSANTLYGATSYGGSSTNAGTVFAINTDGTGFTVLHTFAYGDGSNPYASLILSGNTLYGTTFTGGSLGYGTVFAVNTDGSGFTSLHSFINDSDGASPQAGLILSGTTLYGTTQFGGGSGNGTVFSLSLPPPQLTIIRSAANVVLSWPTNFHGLTLQSTTNLLSTNWLSVPDTPAIAGNQFCVTNNPAGSALFYRLRGN